MITILHTHKLPGIKTWDSGNCCGVLEGWGRDTCHKGSQRAAGIECNVGNVAESACFRSENSCGSSSDNVATLPG